MIVSTVTEYPKVFQKYGYAPPVRKIYGGNRTRESMDDCMFKGPRRGCTILKQFYCQFEDCNFYKSKYENEGGM